MSVIIETGSGDSPVPEALGGQAKAVSRHLEGEGRYTTTSGAQPRSAPAADGKRWRPALDRAGAARLREGA